MDYLARWTTLSLRATALAMLPACGPGTDALDDGAYDGELEFRCNIIGGCPDAGDGGTTLVTTGVSTTTGGDSGSGGSGGSTGGKTNTSYLGYIVGEGGNEENAFPLNNLPLAGGTIGGVRLLEIRAQECQDPTGQVLQGSFVSAPNPLVGVSATGELLSQRFHDPNDTTVICTVEDEHWIGTEWEIEYGDATQPFVTKLRIEDILPESGTTAAPLYDIRVDSDTVPDPRTGWLQICDYSWEDPGLEFYAYLVPSLVLDPVTGNFDVDPNTVFVSCLSGSVGKAWLWGYKSFVEAIGPEGHEIANNAIRAEYCGDDVSYTTIGTHVWFQSTLGPDPAAPDPVEDPDWQVEAVWTDDPHAPAACVSTTRRPEHQPANGFPCDGFTLPECTPSHVAKATLVTWAKGDGL